MKDKLALEIEKGVNESNSKVGVSVSVDMMNGKGSKLSGSVLTVS